MEGKFNGKIQVTEILNIKAKAIIHGEVICGKLSVEPGAEFSASCVMKPYTKSLPQDQPKPEEKNQ
ncbi:bactofilin family protein [Flavobacterium sp. 3HN19-14]|uniref:bactofilin family protein n=1 Tax=Flavobacterium sp. 3HN19-14 TaxID=3448133 RepID=UPI003EE1D2FF